MNTFAKRLHAILDMNNMAIRDLESKTGITGVTLSRVLNDDRPLNTVNIVKVANAFGADVRYFFEEDDDKAMAYLRKDGQETNEELKQAIRDTGDKLDQVVTNVKAMFYDFLSHMYMDGRQENEIKIALGLMSELTGKLSGAVKDM